MHNFLIPFGEWLQNRNWVLAVVGSDWAYPFIQATHFTGLSLWVGTSVALDLSLLGWGNQQQMPVQLSDALFVWNWIGFAVAVGGGFVLFAGSAATYVINSAFLVKISLLAPAALVVHIVNQVKVRTWGQTPNPPTVAKLMGMAEIVLWVGVATAAVAIPYVSSGPPF